MQSAKPMANAPAHALKVDGACSKRTSKYSSSALFRLFSAKTSPCTAYSQTSGAKAKAPPAARPVHVHDAHLPTAAESSVAASAPHTAEERLTRHAGSGPYGSIEKRRASIVHVG